VRERSFEIQHRLQIAIVAKKLRDGFPAKQWIKKSRHVMFIA
jgi:hypothetical protein